MIAQHQRPSCCRRSSTSSTSTSSTSSTVSFDTVEIRGYHITLGDNPSCSRGPPISLDWTYEQELVMKVDEYESHYHQHRRSKEQMIVPSMVREEMIRANTEYSRSDIQESIHTIQKIQKSRAKHATQSKSRQRNEEILESITKRVLSRRNTLTLPTEVAVVNKNATDDDTTSSSTPKRHSFGSMIVRRVQNHRRIAANTNTNEEQRRRSV